MKTALMPAVVAISWIGFLANVQAGVQTEPVPSGTGAAVAPAAAPVIPSAIAPNMAPAGTPAVTPAATPAVSPNAAPPVAMNDTSMFDSGLWEGASVGPCCAMCGGGAGCPPDWYTRQGVRVLSRSKTRRLLIASQSPAEGTYKAMLLSPDNPDSYQVVNNEPTVSYSDIGLLQLNNYPSEIFNSKGLGLGVAIGYDVTIGHYLCRDRNNNDHFVEFGFWGLNSWSSTQAVTGRLVPIYDETRDYTAQEAGLINTGQALPDQMDPKQYRGSLRTPFPFAPVELPNATPQQELVSLAFNNGTRYDFTYRSTMNNFEFNGKFSPRGQADRMVLRPDGRWQRQCQPGTYMTYLYGLRFMQIDETLNFATQSHGMLNSGSAAAIDAYGNYDVFTHNSLLGLQIGAEMMFRQCRWAWGVQSKLGPYMNFANQSSVIQANGGGQSSYSRLVANNNGASLIGEVGFQATYKFRPNLMGRAAYDFMWVTGLALAPEQLQFAATPTNSINNRGMIFNQGVSLGLEWMW